MQCAILTTIAQCAIIKPQQDSKPPTSQPETIQRCTSPRPDTVSDGAASKRRKGELKMSTFEITGKIEALKEWEALLAEATAEVEAIKDEIKREMDKRGVEELEAGQYIARFTTVLSNRFDTTAFKKEHGEMYKMYTKQSTSRRFSIS